MIEAGQLADLESTRAFVDAFEEYAADPGARARLLDGAHQRRERAVTALARGASEEAIETAIPSRRRRRELSEEAVAPSTILRLVRAEDPADALARLEGARVARAAYLELAHLWQPDRVALWAPWVWDPEQETGALALMVADAAVLCGSDDAGTLWAITEASHYLGAVAAAAGLGVSEADPLSFDVLAAVMWAAYAVVVVQAAMTKEFRMLLPPVERFAEQVLGVKRGA